MTRRRRTAVALAVSLVLHGVLAVVIWRAAKDLPSPAPPPEPEPIAFELIELPPVAEPPPSPPPPEPVTRPPSPPPSDFSSGLVTQDDAAEEEEEEEEEEGDATGAREEEPSRSASAPRRPLNLYPVIPRLGADDGDDPDPGGRTIRNEPGALPDPSAVAEYNAEQARRKIQGWAEDTLAERRVDSGVVDTYFHDVREALEKELQLNPGISRRVFEDPQKGAKNLLGHLGRSANRYGETGNPYESPSADVTEVRDRHSLNAQAALRDPLGQTPGGKIAEALERSAPAGGMVNDTLDLFLRAVLEIRQRPDGKVTETVLVESSGNRAFDEHVLANAPKAIATVSPPKRQVSARPGEIRTMWEFKGRLNYRKKLKDFEKGRGLEAAASTVASALTGAVSFDEVTGDVYVIDVLDPEFQLSVKLLRVY